MAVIVAFSPITDIEQFALVLPECCQSVSLRQTEQRLNCENYCTILHINSEPPKFNNRFKRKTAAMQLAMQ